MSKWTGWILIFLDLLNKQPENGSGNSLLKERSNNVAVSTFFVRGVGAKANYLFFLAICSLVNRCIFILLCIETYLHINIFLR